MDILAFPRRLHPLPNRGPMTYPGGRCSIFRNPHAALQCEVNVVKHETGNVLLVFGFHRIGAGKGFYGVAAPICNQ